VRVNQRKHNSHSAKKRSAEDSASRRSDGRTWSAQGWLAVRAGVGCDFMRFSIERPSSFHWMSTTMFSGRSSATAVVAIECWGEA